MKLVPPKYLGSIVHPGTCNIYFKYQHLALFTNKHVARTNVHVSMNLVLLLQKIQPSVTLRFG